MSSKGCGTDVRWRIALLALPLALGLVPLPGYAQSQLVAPREGNIWNWKAHQPTRGGTRGREEAAGVALPPQQSGRETREVERLDRQLLSQPNR